MAVRLVVVADDLTGAAEAAVQFQQAGLRSFMTLDSVHPAVAGSEGGVVVICTGTRGDAPSDSIQRLRALGEYLRGQSVTWIFKLIDATMRGNVGQEVEALLTAAGLSGAVLCPALPAQKRVVVGGYLLVDGIPVHRTAVGQDPTSPVKQPSVVELVRSQTELGVGFVGLQSVLMGPAHLKIQLAEARQAGADIVVVDACSLKDLEAIVAAACDLPAAPMLCGSSALAQAYARYLMEQERRREGRGPGRLLVAVVGSFNPAAFEQMEELQQQAGLAVIGLRVEEVIRDQGSRQNERQRVVAEISRAMAEGRDILLRTAESPEAALAEKQAAERLGLWGEKLNRIVTGTLAEILLAVAVPSRTGGFIFTGSDIARGVLQLLGASGLDLVGEVAPGVPVGRIRGGRFHGVPVVTKAGGYGSRQILWEAYLYLQRMGPSGAGQAG